MRAYQAQLGRDASRCLRELRLLRKEPLTRTDKPEPSTMARNEPEACPPPPPSPRASGAGPRVTGHPPRTATLDPADEPRHDRRGEADEVKARLEEAVGRNEPERRPATQPAAANINVPNEPERHPAPAGGAKRTRREENDPFKSVPWPAPAPRRQAP